MPDTPAIDAMAGYLKVDLPEINIIEFVRSGFLPEALVNFIALLGYSAPLDKEILTLQEIVDSFDPTRFNKTNCLFDRKKLLASTLSISRCCRRTLYWPDIKIF
jgi:glutamyl/glutaminyl-tRNA synthetase